MIMGIFPMLHKNVLVKQLQIVIEFKINFADLKLASGENISYLRGLPNLIKGVYHLPLLMLRLVKKYFRFYFRLLLGLFH